LWFDIDSCAAPLHRLGLETAFRRREQQNRNLEHVEKGKWTSDWTEAIFECESALYGDDIEKSLHLRNVLDLYPLHKRVLGLVEYVIVRRLKAKGFKGLASAQWASAFDGKTRLCTADLPERVDRWGTLEVLGNWLLIGHFHAASGASGPLDLAALLEGIVSRVSLATEVSGVCVTLNPATPSVHAKQLADLANKRKEAACMTFYLGKVALELRNAIEHGLDSVVEGGLRVDCPGQWEGKGEPKLVQLNREAEVAPPWRAFSQLKGLSLPSTANAILLTPASLQRCLMLLSLVMHAGFNHLGIW
jgi:hypothetical protein